MNDMTPATEPPGRGHRTLSRGLTGTFQGFLWAAAATALGGAIATFNEVNAFDDVVGGAPGALAGLQDAEEVSDAILPLFSLTATVLTVLAIVWWYQAYKAIERSGCEGRSWSSGWAIGGWFIPIAQLIIPKLVLNEVDRCSAAAEEGSTDWRDRRLMPAANWWWVLFAVSAVIVVAGLGLTGAQLEESAVFDPDEYRMGLWFTAVGLAVAVGASLTGATAVRKFGSRLAR